MLPDFKLNCRPNNQVTITLQNVIKKSKTHESIGKVKHLGKRFISDYVDKIADKNDLKTFYSDSLKHNCLVIPEANNAAAPLALISRFQQPGDQKKREKLGYGQTPKIKYFSARSGQKIRESGAVLDRLCGDKLDRCRVITLTLPASTPAAYKAISDYSGYAINRLFQVVRRSPVEFEWFFVYEHQKRGALHLHICLYCEHPDQSEAMGNALGKKWYEILKDISNKSGENLLFSRGFKKEIAFGQGHFYNQKMAKGCGAYFSKYASKNSGRSKSDINSINARRYPPASFWGRSRNLSRLCEQQSYKFAYEGIDDRDSESLQVEALQILSESGAKLYNSIPFKKQEFWIENGEIQSLTICEGYKLIYYVSPPDYLEIKKKLSDNFDKYKISRSLDLRRTISDRSGLT
jgi:hypothetical protein